MNPSETLKELGLEAKEIAIYLALLELGETTVLNIANKSGVKRPTAYLILQSLERRGFVSRVARGKKIFFIPQHPKKLVTEAELRLKELKELIPQLESVFHKGGDRPRVMIYEGKENLDRAYDEAFVTKGEINFIDTHKLSYEVFPRTFKKFEYVNLSSEFRVRELVDESEESKKFIEGVRGPYYEAKFIPKEMLPFEMDIGIFGNRTLITSVKKEYFTVAIESEEITRAFRTIFEVMWKTVKE